jgi:hypothetical protein
MKLLIMQFTPASSHFIPFRSKYSPQQPYFKNRKLKFFMHTNLIRLGQDYLLNWECSLYKDWKRQPQMRLNGQPAVRIFCPVARNTEINAVYVRLTCVLIHMSALCKSI